MERIVRYQGAIVQDGKLLLIKHQEHNEGRGYWVIPGGGREDGESEEACVQREMMEETNLQVEVVRLLIEEPAEPDSIYKFKKTYLCRILSGQAAPGYEPEVDAAETYSISEVSWFDLSDVNTWQAEMRSNPITYGGMLKIQSGLGYATRLATPIVLPDAIPVFKTERLILRALTEEDEPAIFAMFSNPYVMRYWSSPAMQASSEALDFITRNNSWFAAREGLTWAITRQTDKAVIGMCTLFDLQEQNRRAEIGYALAQEAWGHGYMHEALTTIVAYAFGPLDLMRLEADIDPRNAASRNALERLGFVQEGLLRERWIVAGEISDSALFGLLRKDWEGHP